MGANVSKAETISKQIVESVLSVQNEISNVCSSNITQDLSLDIDAEDGSTVTITDAELRNYANFDFKCLFSNSTTQPINNLTRSE